MRQVSRYYAKWRRIGVNALYNRLNSTVISIQLKFSKCVVSWELWELTVLNSLQIYKLSIHINSMDFSVLKNVVARG